MSIGVHLIKTGVLGLAQGSVEVVEPRVCKAVVGVVLSLVVCVKAILVSSHGLDGALSTNLPAVRIYHVRIRSISNSKSTNMSIVDLVHVLGMSLLVQLLLYFLLEFV